jgi:large subunit ribosomal protein L3
MCKGLIAKKLGMSRVFLENGEAVAVTYLQIEPNAVIRVKTVEKDGYNAVVQGIEPRMVRTRKGNEHTKYRFQKEWRMDSLEGVEAGKTAYTAGDMPAETIVTVTGTSKGKGFQGVVRRHHFAGGPASHGSTFHRRTGSIGMRALPGRVHKGKRMPGHMGHETVTVRQRPVIVSDPTKGIIGVKGPVPGPNGAAVYLTVESSPVSK